MGLSNFFKFSKKPEFNSEIVKSDRTKMDDTTSVITNSTKVLDYTVNVLQTNAFKTKKKPISHTMAEGEDKSYEEYYILENEEWIDTHYFVSLSQWREEQINKIF